MDEVKLTRGKENWERYIRACAMGFGLACFDGIVGLGDTVVVIGASRHV